MTDCEDRKQRVLVAEDVRLISYKIVNALESREFDIEVAQDGEQCLEKIESFKPDLIILDLMMPKVHGMDILRTIKSDSETDHIGVIVCTSQSFSTEQRLAEELGAFDFISKPIQRAELLSKIDRFFSKSGIEERPPASQTKPETVEAFRPAVEMSRSHFKLWGTRGSTPVPGSQYTRYGGNTSCLEVSCGGELLIFDAGSGIRNLGLELLQDKPRKIHLFITHTHWDHIQGFPFFTPAFIPGFDITIYGAKGFRKDLKSIFEGQLDSEYFPVQMEDMHAKLEFKTLSHSPVRIGNYNISWEWAHHPSATVAYKIDIDGQKLGWMPDNEFLRGYLGPPDDISCESEIVTPYLPLIEFVSDIDIFISESQYTNEEYPSKIGWGHTSVSNGCVLIKLADIKKWIVTHHDPMHDDGYLEDKLNLTQQLMQQINHSVDISHGYDGMIRYL